MMRRGRTAYFLLAGFLGLCLLLPPVTAQAGAEGVSDDAICMNVDTGVGYTDFGLACQEARDGDTIRMLADFTHRGMVTIHKKTVIFDLNCHVLHIYSDGIAALKVTGGGEVKLLDFRNGRFDITGNIGVWTVDGSKAEVTSVFATGDNSIGVICSGEVIAHGGIVPSARGKDILLDLEPMREQETIQSDENPSHQGVTDGVNTVWELNDSDSVLITGQPQAVSAAVGDTVQFEVHASISDYTASRGFALHYQWHMVSANGQISSTGTDSPTLTITRVALKDDACQFYCIITSEQGTTNKTSGLASFMGANGASSDRALLTVTADTYRFPFDDVSGSAWYYDDVKAAHKKGLIAGKTATQFRPNDTMTVAEAVKLAACLHQLHHEGAVSLQNGDARWYDSFMAYALENGILETDLSAAADTVITRARFVSIFFRALPQSEFPELNAVADGAIPDVGAADESAEAIYAFYRAGILTGSDAAGSFHPASSIERSEVAAILTRMLDGDARKTITLP